MTTPQQIKAAAVALMENAAKRQGVTLTVAAINAVPKQTLDEFYEDAEAALVAAASVTTLILPGGLNG